MAIKVACLNARGLRDQSKVAHLFRDFQSFGVDVAAIQVTLFATSILISCRTTLLSSQYTETD